MRKKEIAIDVFSQILWVFFIPCMIIISNSVLRFLLTLVGIVVLFGLIELVRYILMNKTPFFDRIIEITKIEQKKGRVLGYISLGMIPLSVAIVITIMINMLNKFFECIGAY